MLRILLDENMPFGVRRLLSGHDVVHATEFGWEGMSNGRLLDAAEERGFDMIVTADQNMRYQQNLSTRRLAMVVLSTNRWSTIRSAQDRVDQAVRQALPGEVRFIDLGRG